MSLVSCDKNCNCAVDPSSKEFTSTFQCKNHCKGSGSDTKSPCPCCSDMQNNASEFTHCCPNHSEMKGFENQKCKKCDKILEKINSDAIEEK